MKADYVIIGSGSAGSALAYRLSEDGKNSVIILEYGGSDRGPLIQMPGALAYPMNMSRYDWGYKTEPEPHLGGRRLVVPRGKVIGGSSSINGMIYVRGHALDYDRWEELGARGWAYSDILPYFKRMESWDHSGLGGDASWRGDHGPLHVTRGARKNPLFDVFVRAAAEAGYPVTSDYNGYQQEGFGPFDMTVYQGRRWSAANAYLKPALMRNNLRLIKGFATRIEFENKRARGVIFEDRTGQHKIEAKREVILAAGAINSPQILMLSGIGDAEALGTQGIHPIADRKAVGQNLQDHLEVYVQFSCSQPVTLAKYWNPLSKAWIAARWLLTKTGAGASNQFESAGFVRSDKGIQYPDIQFHFLPIAIRYDGKKANRGHGFQAHVGPMRSRSRGFVRLASSDPKAPPKIQFNYMSHQDDWADFRKSIRLTREIFHQKAFEPYLGSEIQPGAALESNDALDAFLKDHVESAYHPCGTCKMGAKDDPLAVVDPEGRVIGVEGLRVADSSIFPQITNGNLNAPSIMVGEKIADHILGKAPLPRENALPWVHPDWENEQR